MKSKHKKSSRGGSVAVNLLIMVLIALLYLGIEGIPEEIPSVSALAEYKGEDRESVALQFLVTWDTPLLESLLDTLIQENVCVTFIVSGEWATDQNSLLLRMLREGHEIGVCGYSPYEDGDYQWTLEDISRSLDIIREAAGVTPTVYYGGSRDAYTSSRAAEALGLRNVLCTADLLCARGDSDDIIKRFKSEVTGGGIYLLTPTPAAKDALPGILDVIRQMNLSITTTGQILTGVDT